MRIATICALAITVSASAAIPTSEREALVALYQSTNGNAWTNKTNWLGAAGTECTWYGVTCDEAQAHVERLDLYQNNLDGTLPSDLRKLTALHNAQLWQNNLRGALPSQISELSQLEVFSAQNNHFSGTIPAAWGALKKLTELGLDGNELKGPLPVQLGDMSGLEQLLLAYNAITGTIPKELGNLTNLQSLSMNVNFLGGTIPKELGSLRKLAVLDLDNNDLTGAIPAELGNLSAIVDLDLANNALTGGIPAALGKLKTLDRLELSNNPLGGTISKELGDLPAIRYLTLADAQLTGAIPTQIWDLETLEELQLGGNALTGTIPADVANLKNLQVLGLYGNDLDGTIQIAIANIAPLRSLELGGNAFTGGIPPDLAKLTNLTWMDLSGNALTGAIPYQLGSLTNLEFLSVYDNQLSGAIPAELGQLTKLTDLSIGANRLSGTIPDALRNLTALDEFIASSNQLTGTIPPWIGEWTVLSYLSLGANRLRGTVPPGLSTLENLVILDLEDNELSGALPDLSRMANLAQLELNQNRFTGTIPASYGSLSKVAYFTLGSNALTGAIPKELGGLTAVEFFDLANNSLDGTIPPELGNLPNCYNISLGANRLGGTIPKGLGNLPSLQYLGLAFNALRGPIPKELTKLTKLEDRGSNFGWNALFTTDSAVKAFINKKQDGGDFEETQTVTPTNAKVTQMTDRSATLTWTPIRYTYDPGGYQVIVRKSPGGEPVAVATTRSTGDDTITVRRLDPSTQYFFTVSTVTHPFDAQKNLIVSDPTQTISASTGQRVIAPPEVVVVEQPTGMVQIDGAEAVADRFTIANFGDVATQLSLEKDSDFFTITPTSFSLGAGATQVVTLHSVQRPAGRNDGYVFIEGPGTDDDSYVLVTLLSSARPAGTVVAEPLATTIEVAGLRGADSAGTAQFRNTGTAPLTGIVLSDQPWIEVSRDPITIDPGTVGTITFRIVRSRRPASEGALVANLRLVYVTGGTFARGIISTLGSSPPPPGIGVSIVTVVDTTQPTVTTGPIPAPGFGELPLFIPGMRSTPSVRSDLALLNGLGGRSISDLRLYFTRGTQTSIASLLPLAASTALNLVNLIGSVYNSEGSGTLQVRTADWESVSADAKVTAIAPEGTRGGAIPVFRGDRSIVPGESLGLAGIAAPGDLLLQETGGATAAVHVDFVNAAGTSISTRDQLLERYQLVEWTDGVPNGAVAAIVTSISGSFTAYARLRDASGDTWSVVDWSRFYRYERDGAVRVPFADGRSGLSRRRIVRHAASFSTALTLFNPGIEEARARIDTIETSGRTVSREVTLASHTSQTLSSAGSSSLTETAQLVITPTRGELIVTARSRATTGGTAIPVLPASAGLRLGQTQTFTALDDASTQRTSFGFAETSGASVTIRARIFIQGAGNSLVTTVTERDYTLGANAQIFVPELVRAFAGDARESLGDLHNLVLELEVVGGGGSVVPFVIATDEGTGDTSLRL
ncbi:MAG TPA: fibronectin type III domain-containing protein [Thermoanaerobaculia bacterium]|jgi:Leucine-rich repeat (LRR) protein|nr:fibronectin type III domain-containing protein [Thermoanaerobaculia bacterium]